MDTKTIEILERNVRQLSRQTEQEIRMMPQTEASLPSVEQVKKIINLVKSIIFPDYFNKRQCHETIRSYNIGVHMEELLQTLARQISYGLQFGEKSEAITSRQQVQDKARDLTLQLIDALPEIKRLLYTDVQAMFDNDPAAINYGEIIFSYPDTNCKCLSFHVSSPSWHTQRRASTSIPVHRLANTLPLITVLEWLLVRPVSLAVT